MVRDGSRTENIGIDLAADTWHHIATIVDVPSQTWRLFLNGEEYLAPDPLDFRHPNDYLDSVNYHSAWEPDNFIDHLKVTAIPEPPPTLVSIANGDWNAAGTWDGDAQMPAEEYDIIVASHAVTVTEDAVADSLQITEEDGKVIVDAGATLNLTEGFTMAAGSQLAIGVGGASTGQIDAGGDASLPGEATLEFVVDGAEPFQAGTYTLITADWIDGTFGSSTGLGRYVSDGENMDGLAYTDTALTVTIDWDLHPGDANLSSGTDLTDFNLWNTHKFTAETDWAHGDFNGDGTTDLSDFNIWNANKFTLASGGAAPAPTEVPEPAALLLLAAAGVLLVWRGVCPRTLLSKEMMT